MKKIKINNPSDVITEFLTKSISRILFITLFAVTLIPLAFLWTSLSMNSWGPVYKDELAKYKLLANSLVEPIQLKVESYQHKLKILDISLQSSSLDNRQQLQTILTKFTNNFDNAIAVSLLLTENNSPVIGLNKSVADKLNTQPKTTKYIDKAVRYQKYVKKDSVSPIFKSSLSNKPVILITHHLFDKNLNKRGTLFAEIEPNFVKNICANISFGSSGHCTVVDNKNSVISHPNKTWITTRRKLSSHTLIQKLKANNSGSLEYISKTDKNEMLGAYAKIKNLGWGVLVTRPKSEINTPLNSALQNILIWVVAGLLLALTITMLVTRYATQPLKALNDKTKNITKNPKNCKPLKEVPKHSSKEIRNIWDSFANLLTLYQDLNHENNSLNSSSKKDIRKVMSDMRIKNTKKANNIDSVTGLTNGTFFVEELRKSLLIHRGEIAGLILIEVDNYKTLLSKNNEELSNHIIKHVAEILISSTRNDDIVSRYGNTDRFTMFVNDCSPRSIQGTAKKLRSLVEVSPVEWKGNTIYINLSIGIVTHEITEKTTVSTLMAYSERALQKAKSAGENKISTYQNKQIETA